METRRKKSTDLQDFAKRLVLSEEYRSTLRRRVLAGDVSRDFARKLIGYARSPEEGSLDSRWLAEPATMRLLERIADAEPRGVS